MGCCCDNSGKNDGGLQECESGEKWSILNVL